MPDNLIMAKAKQESRIVLTFDLDSGDCEASHRHRMI